VRSAAERLQPASLSWVLRSRQELQGGELVLAELFAEAYITFREVYDEQIDIARVRSWLGELPAEAF